MKAFRKGGEKAGGRKTLFVLLYIEKPAYGGKARVDQNIAGCKAHGEVEVFNLMVRPFRRFPRLWLPRLFPRFTILSKLKTGEFDTVFFDYSFLGKTAQTVKKRFPGIRVVVHYHNFEKQYQYSQWQIKKNPVFFIEKLILPRREKLASKVCDFRVFISEEDRNNICREYGVSAEASAVVPPALKDRFSASEDKAPEQPYVLFLGSSFYANDEAARFLIEKVAPHVGIRVVIAGSGMDRAFPGSYENVEVLGFVPDLTPLVSGASAFVSPVFSGSGSKIKIAEALMSGKYVIGTPASFAGYDTARICHTVAETPEEFIAAIEALDKEKRFFPENREEFLRSHDLKTNGARYAFLKTNAPS